ncbi:MAG: Rieske 2Fe-2S domain-containing protein [Myxococcota bacterium]
MTQTHQPAVLPKQPRVLSAWYVACHSSELGAEPVSTVIWERPLVVWRGSSGELGCLLDRCPHRNVPLSDGRVVGDRIQCGYHGWTLAAEGQVTAVPGLSPGSALPGKCATSYPIRESQGMIWVWLNPDVEPTHEPFSFPYADDATYTTVRRELFAKGSLHQMIENALDVPHTAFLHGGLFRNDGERTGIEVQVRRWHDRCEAEYIGEARPDGWAGWLLSPSGGDVTHFDRFYLPSIIEVEYRIGTENHIVLSAACTPVSDFETKMHAVVSLKTRFPGWLVKLLVQPIALRIFGQDARMLDLQTEAIRRFGSERFTSTEIDLLGPHIMALLKRAERGKVVETDAAPFEKTVTLMV